jgi:hypothetical protein
MRDIWLFFFNKSVELLANGCSYLTPDRYASLFADCYTYLIIRQVNLIDRQVNLTDRQVNLTDRQVNLTDRQVNLTDRQVNLTDRQLNLFINSINLLFINWKGFLTLVFLALFWKKLFHVLS